MSRAAGLQHIRADVRIESAQDFDPGSPAEASLADQGVGVIGVPADHKVCVIGLPADQGMGVIGVPTDQGVGVILLEQEMGVILLDQEVERFGKIAIVTADSHGSADA